jgi:hypothetical protein
MSADIYLRESEDRSSAPVKVTVDLGRPTPVRRHDGRRGSDPGSIHVHSRSSLRNRNANTREHDIGADTGCVTNLALLP